MSPTPAEPATDPAEEPRRSRGWLWVSLGVGVVVLLGLIVGALVVWHFSSVALVPDHDEWGANVDVRSVGPGRIVLSSSDDADRPGLYGLDWQGGHAVVGPIVSRGEGTVTRRLSAVQGYLVPGTKAAIDSDVYAGDPGEALGVPSKTVEVKGELGPMPAWLVPPDSGAGATWAILVHGINGTPQEGLRVLPTLRTAGLTSLLITYRDDQGAPSSPDGLHHLGQTEWRDLESAVRFARAHGARHLVLIGYSMGGAVISQFMQRSTLAQRVDALVLDAPALDWRRILEFNATEMGLPGVSAVPVELAIDARIDTDWDSLDAIEHPEDFHLPILLFHGTEDEVVPIASSDRFAAELHEYVTYYRVPHANHVESWNVAPRIYDARLERFLRIAGRARPRRASSSPAE